MYLRIRTRPDVLCQGRLLTVHEAGTAVHGKLCETSVNSSAFSKSVHKPGVWLTAETKNNVLRIFARQAETQRKKASGQMAEPHRRGLAREYGFQEADK